MSRAMPRSDAALLALRQPLHGFVRDDDAGWDDEALLRLLDVMHLAHTPIDLAVIPRALGEALTRELRLRLRQLPQGLGVHQHGLQHANHEAEGRKCEFGASRSAPQQQADLREGRERLREAFGDRLDPFFTPPWNRCDPATPDLLAALGYQALSREHRAPSQQALPELPVCVDWSRQHRDGGPQAVDAAIADAIAACGREDRPLGLMLHHATMSANERQLLAAWLLDLQDLARLHWHRMQGLLPAATKPQGPSR